MMDVPGKFRDALCPVCRKVGSNDHYFHFYAECPVIAKARRTIVMAEQHEEVVVCFNQPALLSLRDADPLRLSLLAFDHHSKAPVKLKKFLLAFVLTFNWCAWHIRCQAETDPEMLSPATPDRIHNKIVELTITTLNKQFAVASPTPETRLPTLAAHPGDVSAMRRPFQDIPRAFALSPHDNNFRPPSAAELHELGLDVALDDMGPGPDWDDEATDDDA